MDNLSIWLVVIDANFTYVYDYWYDIDDQAQHCQTTINLSRSFKVIVIIYQYVFHFVRYIRFHLRKNQLFVTVIFQFLEYFVWNREYSTQCEANKTANNMEHEHHCIPKLLVCTAYEEDDIDEEA